MSLRFESLTYGYSRKKRVFEDFSWEVQRGRTVLLGPNGAGKSTLIGLGANALTPKAGRVSLGELDPRHIRHRARYRRLVGWMPQQIRAVPGLTAREQVAYAGWLKGLSRTEAWQRAGEALEMVDLTALGDSKASTLSGGQLRRVGLAQVLVHSPQVLLLDEPSVGLDPAQRARFRDILTRLPGELAVLVSTHQVDDLSEVYDRVAVITEGRIVFEGPVGDFMSLAPDGPRRAEVAYAVLLGGEH